MSVVFCISDCHFPFHNKRAYTQMLKELKAAKPTHVVQIGDLLDQYVFSKYSRSLEITPNNEITLGLRYAEQLWTDVARLAPKAKRIQILGNHDMRLAKRIAERLPEMSLFLEKGTYTFPGVKVLKTDRDYMEIDGVVYVHGWLSKSIDHAKHFNKPVVHGHRHRMIIETYGKLWSMDVGYMADGTSLPLMYTQSKFTHWTLGCGVVENGKPRLIFLGGNK